VDYEKVLPRLGGTAFAPCKFFNGKAGVLVNFFEYRQSAIGPYNEVGLAILCYPTKKGQPALLMPQFFRDARKWTFGAYVIDLPVTTEIAYIGGKEIWNYPKFVTDITFKMDGKKFSGGVMDPDLKKPIFTLDGKIGLLGMGRRLSNAASFISHTTHQGKPRRTLSEVEAQYRMNLGFSGRLQVSQESRHVMTQNLREMGLQGEKPAIVLSAEKARMKLNGGIPLE
jgi:hypothetical protein